MPIPTSLVFTTLGVAVVVFYIFRKKRQAKLTPIYLALGIILIFLGIIPGILVSLDNKSKSIQVDCEKLNVNQCLEYNLECSICGESITSSFAGCHSREFCQNTINGLVNHDIISSPEGGKAIQIAEQYILNTKEYKENNGRNLELLNIKVNGCPDCYTLDYEYVLDSMKQDELTDIASVKIQLNNWEVVDVVTGYGVVEKISEKLISGDFYSRDKAIIEYLLTQNEFAWQTESGSKNTCVFENLGKAGDLFPLSLWVLCQEYKIVDGEIKIYSGASGPVLVDYPNELSYFSLEKMKHKVPRDGKLYNEDIKEIFPEELQNKIYTYGNQEYLGEVFNNSVRSKELDEFVFKGESNKEMEEILKRSYVEIVEKFDIDFDKKIEVEIFPTQEKFWQATFPDKENNNSTTGFADHVNNKIYLTSIRDTSVKSREEMLKVPTHELVHILIPHAWVDLREGIAVYLANQLKDFSKEDIPSNLDNLVTYQGEAEDQKMQYSFAGWKIKFIIEECLNEDYEKFLSFISEPEKELDYSVIGFQLKGDFINKFKLYLVNSSI